MSATRNFLFLSMLLWGLILTSCHKEEVDGYDGMGKKPVYLPIAVSRIITNTTQQPVEATGGIFLLDTLFFMTEQRKGIHVYDVADASNPIYLTFFSIPAIGDFTIAGNRLYADSWRDLVTIDISNIYAIIEIARVENVFMPLLYPSFYNGWFECIDEDKGAVVGWEDAHLIDAKCRTIN